MGQSFWKRHGRRRWMNGERDQKQNCLNGLESDQARSPEIPSLPMMKTKVLLKHLLEQKKRRRRKKRRRNKDVSFRHSDNCHNLKMIDQITTNSRLLDNYICIRSFSLNIPVPLRTIFVSVTRFCAFIP